MPVHPTGVTVDIVGVHASSNERSCEEHPCCGHVLKLDILVRFREVQVNINGTEETGLAVYWVTDGIDRFLPRYCVKHKEDYHGKLAQIVEFLEKSEVQSDREPPWKRSL